ncbi:unnamed protein product [Adineta ricciae]|uniref:Uncharacterized protein n=1 Tax=Adineta ricciae TaxID=249248 RepID=A0A815P3Y3_ADIRI|nr:unnamed protein product [Adineta ricciae]
MLKTFSNGVSCYSCCSFNWMATSLIIGTSMMFRFFDSSANQLITEGGIIDTIRKSAQSHDPMVVMNWRLDASRTAFAKFNVSTA